jgi:hypothetical protein
MNVNFDISSIRLLDRFLIIGIVIFIIGIIFCIKYLVRSITISIQRIMHPLPWYSEKLLRKYLISLLFLLIALIGLMWIYSAIELQRYQRIDDVAIAGKVEVKKSGGAFTVIFIPSYENFPSENITRVMRADQWALGGLYLSFPSWLKFIGLHTCHKPLDFASKNFSQIYRPSSDYLAQLNNKPDRLWSCIYKIQEFINIKIAYFRLTAFTEAKEMKYEIHATPSGYVITRIGKKGK